ncbi:hypothetical protein KDW_44230 [Dictyobacter vulcani]|uniref:UspA domain-containing protein n=1 Tax=Dictyobacter vulcani TaxID=2607529 RepID=A0A5J4KUQ9_9CHLR|nr:universal stress protein [Dictyobacter vulcani]GER90261.1 hypothetical protein KDW_44230 [Dictyobacter vulcani]
MRVLCCLDGDNLQQIQSAMTPFVQANDLTVGLIYVVDNGPRDEMARKRDQLLRPLRHAPARETRIEAAEIAVAQDILFEGKQVFAGAELLQKTGRPEREIVNTAAEWDADLLLICPRNPRHASSAPGPKSVGHVARFVLDHAPCPVLLVRQKNREMFPLKRAPSRPLHEL